MPIRAFVRNHWHAAPSVRPPPRNPNFSGLCPASSPTIPDDPACPEGFVREHLRGNLHGYVQIGDRSWNVRQGATGKVVVRIDQRNAELNYHGTNRPDMIEASYQGAFPNFLRFVEAFALGLRMQILFPGENVAPWSADLRGTRAVTEAFLACARRI